MKLTQPVRRFGRLVALATAATLLAAPLAVAPAASAAPLTSTAASAGSVAALKTVVSTRPTISGKVRVGSKLTAKPGTWTKGTTLTYTWKVSGKAVKTGKTFTPAAKHVGKKVTVAVRGKKSGYRSVTRTSAAKTIAKGVFKTVMPTISGSRTVGATLTAKAGSWSPTPTRFTYQWRADGAVISGKTSKTLRLTSAQNGKRITVKITGSRAGYATVSRTSAATAKVVVPPPVPGNGSYRVGSEVKPGTYVSKGGSLCYWERRSSAGSSFEGIIANGFSSAGQVIVTIGSGDMYFVTDGCGSWVTLAASGSPKKTSVSDGIYAVGQHMAAGTYKTAGKAGCYYAITSGFSGEFDELLDNDFTSEKSSRYVDLVSGQGFETSGCGTWTKVG
ncbi:MULTISPECIES: hypothetical protein [unclassified Isoptericola]|uniref:hypothetical protein n=1 Tax=unclassified Isoptericola TaxID=2623355 RepID=UPI0036466D20